METLINIYPTYIDYSNYEILVHLNNCLFNARDFIDGKEMTHVEPSDSIIAGKYRSIREITHMVDGNANKRCKMFARIRHESNVDDAFVGSVPDKKHVIDQALRIREDHPELINDDGVFNTEAYLISLGGHHLPIDIKTTTDRQLIIRKMEDFDFTTTIFGSAKTDNFVCASSLFIYLFAYCASYDEYRPTYMDIRVDSVEDDVLYTLRNVFVKALTTGETTNT